VRRQNSSPSGSASTLHETSPCPTSAGAAPRAQQPGHLRLLAVAGVRPQVVGVWVIISSFILDAMFPVAAPMYWSNTWSGAMLWSRRWLAWPAAGYPLCY
jgi:hypothetical protein